VISAAAATMISVAKLAAGVTDADSEEMEMFSAGDKSSCTVFKVSVMCVKKLARNSGRKVLLRPQAPQG
jgi:hypothetical protein